MNPPKSLFPTIRPTRVLMTADAITGVWNYALELARALRPHGVEITLALMGPPPTPHQNAEASAVSNLTLRHRPYKLEWMPNPWDDLVKAGGWLLDLEEEIAPSLVHLNAFSLASLPWSVPVLLAAHCDRPSWAHARSGCNPFAISRYHQEVGAGLRGADLIVAPTRDMLGALEDVYNLSFNTQSMRVIPHGRCPSRFQVMQKRPFVLAATNQAWEPSKNMALLDAAAAETQWPVFLAGNLEEEGFPPAHFLHLTTLGPLGTSDLANWMGLASVFVHPSLYEPFGTPPLEAALSGCALLLSDIPSLREVWRDSALYFSPNEPRSLAKAIRRLSEDAPLRMKMGERARRHAFNFNPEQMAESYYESYCELLARTSPQQELDVLP